MIGILEYLANLREASPPDFSGDFEPGPNLFRGIRIFLFGLAQMPPSDNVHRGLSVIVTWH
jgi:hypothetical protein